MRLYDQIKANGATTYDADPEIASVFEETINVRLSAAVLVDITNVANYAAQHLPLVMPNNAPIRVSPWPVTWYEWRAKFAPGITQIAVLLEQVHVESGAHMQMHTFFVGSTDSTARPVALGAQVMCIAATGELYETTGPLPITDEERHDFEAAGWRLPTSRDLGARGTYVPAHIDSQERRETIIDNIIAWMESGDACTGLAMTFAHCKNVKIQDNHTPPKVAAKRKKAGKPPGTTYKTLLIDPMKEVLRTEGNIEKNGLKKALHIVRGHFATYTEEAPLFGKVTGTFWKPMHARGNKKHGEIKKDYAIDAPH